MNKQSGNVVAGVIVSLITCTCILIAFLLWGVPHYRVYVQEMRGKATLQEADWNRQVAVREAQARLESEELNAKSEIVRAKGVAEANKIVSQGLGGPEGYLRYLYINMLKENTVGSNTFVYIPTEAGIPILEAGRLGKDGN